MLSINEFMKKFDVLADPDAKRQVARTDYLIIYAYDLLAGNAPKDILPKCLNKKAFKKKLERTEGDDNYDYNYLAFEDNAKGSYICPNCKENHITELQEIEKFLDAGLPFNCPACGFAIKDIREIVETDNKFYNGRHGKYFGVLNEKEFKEFCIDADLKYTTEKTGGSLTPMGSLPAIYLAWDGYNHILQDEVIECSAYITPMVEERFINDMEACINESVSQNEELKKNNDPDALDEKGIEEFKQSVYNALWKALNVRVATLLYDGR